MGHQAGFGQGVVVLEQPGTELLLFGFRQAQPQLAAAPQNVFQNRPIRAIR